MGMAKNEFLRVARAKWFVWLSVLTSWRNVGRQSWDLIGCKHCYIYCTVIKILFLCHVFFDHSFNLITLCFMLPHCHLSSWRGEFQEASVSVLSLWRGTICSKWCIDVSWVCMQGWLDKDDNCILYIHKWKKSFDSPNECFTFLIHIKCIYRN